VVAAEHWPRRVIRTATFVGLMLLFPCPWFMFAVGGLLPLPVIVAYGAGGGMVLAVTLIHLVVYTWIFYKAARWVGRLAGQGPVRQGFVSLVVATGLLAISFAPIYGSGENLLSGHKLRHTAWAMYQQALAGRR
jgi:hypothetical protein